MSWVDERGIQIEPPHKDEPAGKLNEIRATVLIWSDLHRAGIPLRDIAECFEVDFTVISDYLKQMPEKVKNRHVTEEYLGRLDSAVAASRGSGTRPDVRRILKALLSTHM
ncbi:MAG: hypothetical protein P4L67_05020 [Candidatus Pacebacteria bacterium]|nr:hypothetical protein [Candidatus Paceibacterota bacterium]